MTTHRGVEVRNKMNRLGIDPSQEVLDIEEAFTALQGEVGKLSAAGAELLDAVGSGKAPTAKAVRDAGASMAAASALHGVIQEADRVREGAWSRGFAECWPSVVDKLGDRFAAAGEAARECLEHGIDADSLADPAAIGSRPADLAAKAINYRNTHAPVINEVIHATLDLHRGAIPRTMLWSPFVAVTSDCPESTFADLAGRIGRSWKANLDFGLVCSALPGVAGLRLDPSPGATVAKIQGRRNPRPGAGSSSAAVRAAVGS